MRSLGAHENYLVKSGFSLYQGKKTKKYKELGPAKLPIRPLYSEVPLYLAAMQGKEQNIKIHH